MELDGLDGLIPRLVLSLCVGRVFQDVAPESVVILLLLLKPITEKLDISSTFHLLPVDEDFYSRYNVPISALEKLGVVTSPVSDGPRANYDGRGDGYWIAQGDYCPYLEVDGLSSNLLYIHSSNDDRLAKQKSAEILKLLQSIYKRLTGKVRKRRTNPYFIEERAHYLDVLDLYQWVYSKEGTVHSPKTLSRFELNEEVYGDIYISKEAGAAIGFIEKEEDKQAEAFDYVDALDKRCSGQTKKNDLVPAAGKGTGIRSLRASSV